MALFQFRLKVIQVTTACRNPAVLTNKFMKSGLISMRKYSKILRTEALKELEHPLDWQFRPMPIPEHEDLNDTIRYFEQIDSLMNSLEDRKTLKEKKRYFKCSICDYQTPRRSRLNYHIIAHRGLNTFECKLCEYKNNKKINMKDHILKVHKKTSENFKQFMNVNAEVMEELQKMNKRIGKANFDREKNVSCQFCSKKFRTNSGLRTHLKVTHKIHPRDVQKQQSVTFE